MQDTRSWLSSFNFCQALREPTLAPPGQGGAGVWFRRIELPRPACRGCVRVAKLRGQGKATRLDELGLRSFSTDSSTPFVCPSVLYICVIWTSSTVHIDDDLPPVSRIYPARHRVLYVSSHSEVKTRLTHCSGGILSRADHPTPAPFRPIPAHEHSRPTERLHAVIRLVVRRPGRSGHQLAHV